jgi:hypothetical protein
LGVSGTNFSGIAASRMSVHHEYRFWQPPALNMAGVRQIVAIVAK